jgi:transposase
VQRADPEDGQVTPMSERKLFDEPTLGHATEPAAPKRDEGPRVVSANRDQLAMRMIDFKSLLPANHRARAIWSAVEKLDLAQLYARIKAREGGAGRPAIDPKVLLALWLYATSEGIGSARRLARLCEEHDAYRWICGGLSVSYHALSDFRTQHGGALDELLTQLIAVLLHQKLVKLETVAQDGMRVRASAGAASFRREPTLRECLAAAERQLVEAKRQSDEPDAERGAREQAAAERAVREREERVAQALAELPKVRESKPTDEQKRDARASTTDAQARVMKMADGGFRPAYNVQIAADVGSRLIVGISVTNAGNDARQVLEMLEQLEGRTGRVPNKMLLDGGFAAKENIDALEARGVTVYAPVATPRKPGIDRHARKRGDSDAVARWRARMASADAKRIYKDRGATVETINGDLRMWRGFERFVVRGLEKVRCVALLGALTHNILRIHSRLG